ncbi:efflux RND transporter periplasmic adaptor subunit [Chitinophaga rhizophila]|uniref:Efflux RND transporter periplasmic adaptor subunit n=1 Tax=Chitinophaga rhizophila TaxID=2866212 RepID=A0ABS7G5Q9_9BACT|nr:efflux RND transporter periplasmic adaptor subunit [Chitinophaga rhizophila]MBW8682992.1 efflux RND transporter periplasmic adaptor subunit [Chitinophaga rhizophila]
MRNSYIVNISLLTVVAIGGLTACTSTTEKAPHAEQTVMQQYTCPMHPDVVRTAPGTCPVCNMDLVQKHGHTEQTIDSGITRQTKPVNAQVIATIPVTRAETGMRIYNSEVQGVVTYDTRNQTSIASRVGGRVERLLIRYNYQPVRKGQLIMEIYSPDLAAAQREMLYVAQQGSGLLDAAKQRLLLLGMQQEQIAQVLKTGTVSYRIPVYSNSDGYILEKSSVPVTPAPAAMPAAASDGGGMDGMSGGGTGGTATSVLSVPATAPVLLREGQYVNAGQSLFTIYHAQSLVAEFAFPASLAASLRQGQKILFAPAGNGNVLQAGSIGLIEPVFKNGMNFTRARVYLKGNQLQVGQLLTGNIPVVYNEGWWLPAKAVWKLGKKAVVFRKNNEIYTPVEVETGATVNGMVQVKTDISVWDVAASAHYLVDSESFIKTDQ